MGRLTASIAHEIRNPLGAISHAVELLSESSAIEKEDQRLLEIIHNHAGRVNNIVKSVLQLSRQDESHIQRVSLRTWLAEFETHFNEQFGLSQSPFKITLSDDINDVHVDPNQLKQIIDNLCGNALTYGQRDSSRPVIDIRCRRHTSNQRVFISVSDDGAGIEEKNVAKIFEPFYTTSACGTGLGLYISSQLAELNQAKLSYFANAQGGSRFTLHFNHP